MCEDDKKDAHITVRARKTNRTPTYIKHVKQTISNGKRGVGV